MAPSAGPCTVPGVDVSQVVGQQEGVIVRRQAIAAGLTSDDVARLIRRREWARVHPGVYVDHTGPLQWSQRAWAAVLGVGRSVLCHTSALRAAEGPGAGTDPTT